MSLDKLNIPKTKQPEAIGQPREPPDFSRVIKKKSKNINLNKYIKKMDSLDEKDYPVYKWIIRRIKSGRKHPMDEFIMSVNEFRNEII